MIVALATVRYYLKQSLTECNEYYAIADKIQKNASQNHIPRKITDFLKKNNRIIMRAFIV